VGYMGPPSPKDLLKKIEDIVDMFISDYLAVNQN
jgi:hypothetical protein